MGGDWSYTNLRHTNLSRQDLRGIRFTEADLMGCNLQKSDLRGADLSRVQLSQCKLKGADLRDAIVEGIDLKSLDLQGVREMLTSIMYNSVSTVVYSTLAFMIGILTTSTGVTIGVTMFMLMIDKLVIFREFYKYVLFPNLNLAAYEGGGAPMPGMTLTFSIVMLVLYSVVFLLIGFSVFRRRDVA